ncbi:MAG: hypothetical protein HZA46_12390 [Planctomycetales bacterium]|nr:hypothetical protein [Planctomycetales bacterium]
MLSRLPLSFLCFLWPAIVGAAERPFSIQIVDEQTGRGVPLVELKTVNQQQFITDSHGLAAIDEPELVGQKVFFHILSHGYEYAKDGFGYRGVAVTVTPGERKQFKIKRVNLAERLYRMTGSGIYRDSVLVGEPVPIKQPLLNAQVFGSDSVVNAVYRGKVYWFWGDTNRPGYPLGNFHVPGAISNLPGQGGLDPAVGVNLNYFTDGKGFAKETCRMAGQGPTWIGGLTVVPDENDRETLLASYVKIKPPMTVYERGLVKFNDESEKFDLVSRFDVGAPLYPDGHPFRHLEPDGVHVYFATPYPLVRVRATVDDWQHLDRYEAFTCLKEGTRLGAKELDRSPDGQLRYAWKRNTPAVGPFEQKKLIDSGQLKPHEALLQLRDRDTGAAVLAHAGSVTWNAHRRRFGMITGQSFGSSFLGETWYAEADTPVGPWVYATKIVTHDDYSFYNPKQHPFFDEKHGLAIYLEGTYTHTFSGNKDPTPRYDYNQIMYRLDLTDVRTAVPVALYAKDALTPNRFHWGHVYNDRWLHDVRPAFFALDRPGVNTIPVFDGETNSGQATLRIVTAKPLDPPQFFAIALDAAAPPKATVPLFRYIHATTGERVFSTNPNWSRDGFSREAQPLCRVWPSPFEPPTK